MITTNKNEVNLFGLKFCILDDNINDGLVKVFPQLIKTNDLITEFRYCKTCNTAHIVNINKDDIYCQDCNNLLLTGV